MEHSIASRTTGELFWFKELCHSHLSVKLDFLSNVQTNESERYDERVRTNERTGELLNE